MLHSILLQDYSSGAAAMGTGSIIFSLLIVIVFIVAEWKIYTKAGKPGWAILIPIYNFIVLLEIVGKPLWWFLLMLIPFVNFIILIIVLNQLSKSFGYGVGFTLGLIFLAPIFILILGFGGAKYVGPGGAVAPPPAPAA
jgi:hypothetical protein